jgi:excisionase family DNA binding protein
MSEIEQATFSPAQVAEILGKTEAAVRAMIARGEIKVHRWGRRVVIFRDDLEELLQSVRRAEEEGR